MRGCNAVLHLAVNPDVGFGTKHPRKDLDKRTIATFDMFEAMCADGIRRIAFFSTGSAFGEPEVLPTPENVSFSVQTSRYGPSKVAGEG